MEFRLLGPFEVWDGGQQITIAGSKQRALLALLVLRANEVVRTELLVDELWDERPPRNAAAALHTHVSRLRKTLGADTIASREWGYVLRADPAAIDLRRFEGVVTEAEPLAARERATKLAEALALWRGPPLADLVNEPALQPDIARLEELRLGTLERRIDADLEAGKADVVGELETLVAQQPLREHLRWLLILALYRAGRQAEALEVYRETRRVLADELGLEPSPELRELERAILQQDPALRVSPGTAAVVAEAGVRLSRRRRVFIGAALALLLAGLGAATAVALSRPTHASAQQMTSITTNNLTTHQTDTHPQGPPVIAPTSTANPKPAHPRTTTTKPQEGTPPRASRKSTTTTLTATKPSTHPKTAPTPPRKPKPVRITDDFSEAKLDPLIWNSGSGGTGASLALTNGQLVFSIAGNATFDPQYNYAGSGIETTCMFRGDFDARVRYKLLRWPSANGARIALSAQRGSSIVEFIQRLTTPWSDGYQAYPSGTVMSPVQDQSGSLRIARSHGIISAFFLLDGRWMRIGRKLFRGGLSISVGMNAIQSDWQGQDVSAGVNNFTLRAPEADCPAASGPQNP